MYICMTLPFFLMYLLLGGVLGLIGDIYVVVLKEDHIYEELIIFSLSLSLIRFFLFWF